jgi:hypothetical protein
MSVKIKDHVSAAHSDIDWLLINHNGGTYYPIPTIILFSTTCKVR